MRRAKIASMFVTIAICGYCMGDCHVFGRHQLPQFHLKQYGIDFNYSRV